MAQNFDISVPEFIVRLCRDIFLEALLFGDRRRLTKLERVDRRLHRIIENFFKLRPFLRLSLEVIPVFFDLSISEINDRIDIIGNARKQITPSELHTLPPFLRFNDVRISDNKNHRPIEQQFEFIEDCLRQLKSALDDANTITFQAAIRYDNQFTTCPQICENLRNRLLPICASARGYRFEIFSWLYKHPVMEMIISFLQMEEIKRCQNIDIDIDLLYPKSGNKRQLPIDAVLNWLERSTNGMKKFVNNKQQKERSLKMRMMDIQNAREMIEHLKTVYSLKNKK